MSQWMDYHINKHSAQTIYIYSPISFMIALPIVKGHNFQSIYNMGWPLSTIIIKCHYPPLHMESVSFYDTDSTCNGG